MDSWDTYIFTLKLLWHLPYWPSNFVFAIFIFLTFYFFCCFIPNLHRSELIIVLRLVNHVVLNLLCSLAHLVSINMQLFVHDLSLPCTIFRRLVFYSCFLLTLSYWHWMTNLCLAIFDEKIGSNDFIFKNGHIRQEIDKLNRKK